MKYYIECGNLKKEVDAEHWTTALQKAFKNHRGFFGELARFKTYKNRSWQYVAPENYITKCHAPNSIDN